MRSSPRAPCGTARTSPAIRPPSSSTRHRNAPEVTPRRKSATGIRLADRAPRNISASAACASSARAPSSAAHDQASGSGGGSGGAASAEAGRRMSKLSWACAKPASRSAPSAPSAGMREGGNATWRARHAPARTNATAGSTTRRAKSPSAAAPARPASPDWRRRRRWGPDRRRWRPGRCRRRRESRRSRPDRWSARSAATSPRVRRRGCVAWRRTRRSPRRHRQ